MRWLPLVVSLGLGALLAPTLLAGLERAGVVRENYRGLVLPAAAGILIAVVAALSVGPLAALDELAGSDTLAPEAGAALVFVVGVAMLGLVDDLLGGRRPAGAATSGRRWSAPPAPGMRSSPRRSASSGSPRPSWRCCGASSRPSARCASGHRGSRWPVWSRRR